MKKLPLLLGIVLLCSTLLLIAINNPNVTIEPSVPTREDNLTCTWTNSPDVSEVNITWYNGSTIYLGPLDVTGQTNHKIDAYVAKKNEFWTCNLSFTNATTTRHYWTTTLIENAFPHQPNATDMQFYEDRSRTFTIESVDADAEDVLRYYIDFENVTKLPYCSIGRFTGIVSCSPNASSIGNDTILYTVRDGGTNPSELNVTFEVLPVNDAPSFSVGNQNATEGVSFLYQITVNDEENYFPIYFNITSNLSSISYSYAAQNSVYIIFNRTDSLPLFTEKGLWIVTVNATDAGPHNYTPFDNPTTVHSFTIRVITVNHAPNITTDLSDVEAKQRESLLIYINASDDDTDDTLNFSISSDCPGLWSITTTNSSHNGTGRISVANLTNQHVVCRDINISVSDGEDIDWYALTLNISNKNDAPVVHELSSGVNISNLSTVRGTVFTYFVNATDPDNATYEGEVLSYTDNSSLFAINNHGRISFTVLESMVGNHSILINVSDDDDAWDARVLRLIIRNNTAPALNPISWWRCAEDTLCTKTVSASDPDNGENLTFNSNRSDLITIKNKELLSANFTLTANNSMVGNHTINISVHDDDYFYHYTLLTLTINNTNDAPYFDQDKNGIPDVVSMPTLVEDQIKTLRVNISDDDYDIGLDTLSFDQSFISDPHNLVGVFSVLVEGDDYFIMRFAPNSSHNGNYILNISATDSYGATVYQNLNIQVVNASAPPRIREVRPYWNASTQQTETSFVNASLFAGNETQANLSEGNSMVFDVNATKDYTFAGNKLNYYWYVNNVLNTTIKNANPKVNSSINLFFNYFSNGNYTVRVDIIDAGLAKSTFSWELEISDVNRAPILANNLPDFNVSAYTDLTGYFSFRAGYQRFYDADDDLDNDSIRENYIAEMETTNLTYSVSPLSNNCTTADLAFTQDSLLVTPVAVGDCLVTFRATDPYGAYVDSNEVTIYVEEVPVEEVEVNSGSGGSSASRSQIVPIPIDDPVDVPHPLDLVVPQEVNTYENQTVEIPIALVNTWNGTLTGIRINATSSNFSDSHKLRITNDYFEYLSQGENVTTTLIIEGYRLDSPYSVTITAYVEEPDFKDSAVVFINAMERVDSGDDVTSKVTFARDLLNDNPECQELNELLNEAEKERQVGNYDRAIQLVNTVVNGCKYLINTQKEVTPEQPKDFFSVINYLNRNLMATIMLAAIIAIMTGFGIAMIFTSRSKKEDEF